MTSQSEQPTVDELEARVNAWIEARRIKVTPDGRIRACDAAKLVGVDQRTLRRWHDEGLGPQVIIVGKLRWYRTTALIAWLREGETSDRT